MSEITITTRRGVYGRVNVTLPLALKTSMLAWAKHSGMKKSEFLRMALTTGFLALARGLEGVDGAAQVRPPAREEDGRIAPPLGLS